MKKYVRHRINTSENIFHDEREQLAIQRNIEAPETLKYERII